MLSSEIIVGWQLAITLRVLLRSGVCILIMAVVHADVGGYVGRKGKSRCVVGKLFSNEIRDCTTQQRRSDEGIRHRHICCRNGLGVGLGQQRRACVCTWFVGMYTQHDLLITSFRRIHPSFHTLVHKYYNSVYKPPSSGPDPSAFYIFSRDSSLLALPDRGVSSSAVVGWEAKTGVVDNIGGAASPSDEDGAAAPAGHVPSRSHPARRTLIFYSVSTRTIHTVAFPSMADDSLL